MEDRGLLRFKDQAVAKINWDSETHTGNATVTDEKTGTVYQLGGGESDFSIAQVTFKNTLGTGERTPYTATLPAVYENENPGINNEPISMLRNETATVPISLYKGHCYIDINTFDRWDTEIEPVTTGDVNFENGLFEITGNGTIDVAGALGGVQ